MLPQPLPSTHLSSSRIFPILHLHSSLCLLRYSLYLTLHHATPSSSFLFLQNNQINLKAPWESDWRTAGKSRERNVAISKQTDSRRMQKRRMEDVPVIFIGNGGDSLMVVVAVVVVQRRGPDESAGRKYSLEHSYGTPTRYFSFLPSLPSPPLPGPWGVFFFIFLLMWYFPSSFRQLVSECGASGSKYSSHP